METLEREMTAKEYLLQYQIAKGKAKRKREQIEKLRADLLPSGISYDGMPGGNGGKTIDDILVKVEEAEEEWRELNKAVTRIELDIVQTIDKLSKENYKDILFDAYILDMDWDDIAKKEAYDVHYVHRLHGRALLDIKKILKDTKGY